MDLFPYFFSRLFTLPLSFRDREYRTDDTQSQKCQSRINKECSSEEIGAKCLSFD